MRKRVELQFQMISKNVGQHADIVPYTLNYIFKFLYFISKLYKMNDLFQGHFSSIEQTSGRLLSRCGLCDKYMKYISLKPARLHCLNCDMIYQVPQHGSIKLYMEQRCPIDQFEILMFSSGGENGITYTFCPQCYNNPPLKTLKGTAGYGRRKRPCGQRKKPAKVYAVLYLYSSTL